MTKQGQPTPLLRTKLYAPPLPKGLVERPRLHGKFMDGLRSGAHLTLISAPAGYGKTTLVREWIARSGQPYAWLSLDAEDHDPARFLTYLTAALRETLRNGEDNRVSFGESVLMMLRSPQLPPMELLMTVLINDLTELETPIVLVLDDYHLIQNDRIHQATQFFLDHQPPMVHWIVTTRHDPPWTLARARMHNRVTELGAGELRFSLTESGQFLRDTAAVQLAPEVLTALESRTEGWVAGLQLIAMAVKGLEPEAASSFITQCGGNHRFMTDYLFEEVLRLQTAEVREFLHQTSVLSRLSAPLCNAVTGRTDSKEMLGRFDQANLFLIPLDDYQQWYRYHHLFAGYLQSESEPAERKELHRKAAHWFAANGLRIEGVQHALAAEAYEDAMRWMGEAVGELLETGNTATLMEWFRLLPQETVRAHPEMSILRAWCYYMCGQIPELESYLTLLEEDWTLPPSDRDRGRLLCLRAYLATNKGHADSFRLAEAARSLTREEDPFFRILALLAFGQEQCNAGRFQAAIETFREAFSFGQRLEMSFSALLAVNYLTENLFKVGRLREARSICEQVMCRYVDHHGAPTPMARMVYLAMARFSLACNDLPAARKYAAEALAFSREMGMVNLIIDAEVTQAAIQMIYGDWEDAQATIRRLQQLGTQIHLPHFRLHLTAMEADLYRKMGDAATARTLLEQAGLHYSDEQREAGEMRYAVVIRVYLAVGEYDGVRKLLNRMEEDARREGRYGSLVPIGVWQAMAAWGLGDRDHAEAHLAEALRRAAPEGYLRPFVEGGEELVDLFAQVRPIAPSFVGEILRARSGEPYSSPQSVRHGEDELRPLPVRQGEDELRPLPVRQGEAEAELQPLPEPLSEREMEILRLVSVGYSNQDIGQKLFITTGTVKWHLANIYGKLGVKRRTQAVEMGRRMGLIG